MILPDEHGQGPISGTNPGFPGFLPWTIARWFLVILVLGTPTYFFASFNPGMSIADAFATSGGDHAPWSRILYGISLLALITLMLTVTRRDNAQPKG